MKFATLGRTVLGMALCAALVSLAPTAVDAQRACMTTKDLFMNPFNRQSAHHLPIGTGARYASDTHPATRDWLKAGRFSVNPAYEPWGSHMLETSNSDPLRTVNGKNSSKNLPASVRLPASAANTTPQPSKIMDNHTIFFNRDTSTGNEFYEWSWNNGNPFATIMRTVDWRGLGHASVRGQSRVGNTAAGPSLAFGILRGHEINTPGYAIQHALTLSIPGQGSNAERTCNTMLSRDIILPATKGDWFRTKPGYNTGNIPYGALIALPPSVNINGLGLSEPGRRLAEALRDYGARVIDDGGCTGPAMRADQHITPQIRNQLHGDIRKFYSQMRMVLNGEWQPGLTAVGGGQPLAPNCAFDANASQRNVSTPSSSPAASTPQSRQSGSTSSN